MKQTSVKFAGNMCETISESKLSNLMNRAERLGVNIRDVPVIKNHPLIKLHYYKIYITFGIILSLITIMYLKVYLNSGRCLIEMPPSLSGAFRPPQECDFCANIDRIEKVVQITPDIFEQKYAYTGTPVIITDATANWTALKIFDFWYFKNVYDIARKEARQSMNCQFFPYKSGFTTFEEALSIPADRVNYNEGSKPWYFGWSNCNHEVAEKLRQHYGRPYFLPKTSENAATDWIFMGGPGLGAHMHVDNVRLPSWQAQIKGAKEWILAPPPECYYECNFLKNTVKTGEINTNLWYHKTNVLPGEVSITIGAEYD